MGCIQLLCVGVPSAKPDRPNSSRVYLLHYHDVHSPTYTKYAPLLPIPVPRNATNARLDGRTFPYFCQFWYIAHRAASELYKSPGPIHKHVPVAYVETEFCALLEWARSLPVEARRSNAMAHNVCEMQ